MLKSAFVALLSAGLVAATVSGASLNNFAQVNLTSDLPGVAAHQDTNLVNPWGIVAPPRGPFWINDSGFGGSHFIFDTEDGTVSSWVSGAKATLQATAASGSVYKGLAIANNGSANFLYAANFGLGRIDVYDSSFHATTLAGGFSDPNIPSGFAPFDVKNINGSLYVTYAKQDPAKHDDVAGPGNGFVDIFDLNGNFVKRLVSRGALNSPWGLAVAPSVFGSFGGDLLVGNFGDGRINAYNLTTGSFAGTLDGTSGTPVTIQGLWGLSFGNGAFGQNADSLYFTAGIPGSNNVEDHGLFGSLSASTAAPEPATGWMFVAIVISAVYFSRRRRTEG